MFPLTCSTMAIAYFRSIRTSNLYWANEPMLLWQTCLQKPDVVNVFRLPKFIPAIVDQMLDLGLKNLWVQQGIIHLEAAATAETGGIWVVHGSLHHDRAPLRRPPRGVAVDILEWK